MAEDGLMLNITENLDAPVFYKNKSFSFKTSDKWREKRATKRKAFGDDAPPPKQKMYVTTSPQSAVKMPKKKEITKQQEEEPSPKIVSESLTKPKVKAIPGVREAQKHQASTHMTGRDKREGEGHCSVKTSSLFKNNPLIPDIERPEVNPLNEEVFTSNLFSELDLHPHLLATLTNVLKITSMTSVQEQAIPALLNGRDTVIRSQTGSGKTLAYGIPLVQFLQSLQPKVQRCDGPLAVILVPTRELALQSFEIIQKLLKPFMWIVPGILMGGEKRKSEKARLRKGINILISTPGRLVDHINNTRSVSFKSVKWLVLDEADRILDLGFEKDVSSILNALNTSCQQRQNVLLSATWTEGVIKLADVSMRDPVTVQVFTKSSKNEEDTEQPQNLLSIGGSESFAIPEQLKQHVVIVPSKLRLVTLAAFIMEKCKHEKNQKIIVFASSCEVVKFLFTLLTNVLCGCTDGQETSSMGLQPPLMDFTKLHGSMNQQERTEAFLKFSQVKSGILLCTDVAARGLDLPQVTWIIQYTAPGSHTEYVHRVGRTARIGTRGSSLLFLAPSEVEYVSVLASHNITMEEIKMETVLASLLLDDHYKGRKKSHGVTQGEVRVRATVLQTEFENFVHSNEENTHEAKLALQSFLRAYATYPATLKHVFHIKKLHLGHTAKSFGLRDAPQNLSIGLGRIRDGKAKQQQERKRAFKAMGSDKSVANILRSEYSSGMEPGLIKKTQKKKKSHNRPGRRRKM
ncbi:probable ATP-dependent RNA helicase DDX31 [Polypterus senegalus]|uniref:probable ATP-dependent RNA helicase DDX31 n=1 Tax=Polypterus senegalus TaxID=55291 RepID=UPI001964C8FF|nr:probable ATP-dependent RNA helicase DDX31 [Polypterus senegalus]